MHPSTHMSHRLVALVLMVSLISLADVARADIDPNLFVADAKLTFSESPVERGYYTGQLTYVNIPGEYIIRQLQIVGPSGSFKDIVLYEYAKPALKITEATLRYRVCSQCSPPTSMFIGGTTNYMKPENMSFPNTQNNIISMTFLANGVSAKLPATIVYDVPIKNTTVVLTNHATYIGNTTKDYFLPSCAKRNCNLKVDIMFVLDKSGSMAAQLIQKDGTKTTRFLLAISLIRQIANGIGIGVEGVHCGVEGFGAVSYPPKTGDTHSVPMTSDAATFNAGLLTLLPNGGGTCPECGMYAGAQALDTYVGIFTNRSSVPKVMILLTDGEPNCAMKTPFNNPASYAGCSFTSTNLACGVGISRARDYAVNKTTNIKGKVVIIAIGATKGGGLVQKALDFAAWNGGISSLTTTYITSELSTAIVDSLKSTLTVSLCTQFSSSEYPVCAGGSKGLCCDALNLCPYCNANPNGDKCQEVQGCSLSTKYGCQYAPKNCDDSNPCTTDTCTSPAGTCVNTNLTIAQACPQSTQASEKCNVYYCDPKLGESNKCQANPVNCFKQDKCLTNWHCVVNGTDSKGYTCAATDACAICMGKNMTAPTCQVLNTTLLTLTAGTTCNVTFYDMTFPQPSDLCKKTICVNDLPVIVPKNPDDYCANTTLDKCSVCEPSTGLCTHRDYKDASGISCMDTSNCTTDYCDAATGKCVNYFKCTDLGSYCKFSYCESASLGCSELVDITCPPASNELSSCYGDPVCKENKGGCYYQQTATATVNKCGMCDRPDSDCGQDSIPPAIIAAAAIAAGVIAAIIVAIVVFLIVSAIASKKIYDAIKQGKENMTDAAMENKLYEGAETGGSNPLHDMNNKQS